MTGVNSAQPRYGNSFNNSFNNGFDNGLNSNVRAVGKNMSIGKKVLILLLALFVGAAIGFGYWYYHNVSTHTIREENFSVELPRSLEKATTIDYAAQSSDGTVKANGKYADVNSDFQYMILDYSSLAGETTDILTEKLFVTYMKGNLENVSTIQAFGWLSIALVIFTLWRPVLAIAGSVVFGGLYIVSGYVSGISFGQMKLLSLIPYVVTVAVLIVTSILDSKNAQPPKGLGVTYFREDR